MKYYRRWSFTKVRKALEEIRLHLSHGCKSELKWVVYYTGGSLCIDFKYHPSVVLNRNGRGFFYNFKCPKGHTVDTGEQHFVMTNKMLMEVLDIYNHVKGVQSKRIDAIRPVGQTR